MLTKDTVEAIIVVPIGATDAVDLFISAAKINTARRTYISSNLDIVSSVRV